LAPHPIAPPGAVGRSGSSLILDPATVPPRDDDINPTVAATQKDKWAKMAQWIEPDEAAACIMTAVVRARTKSADAT
jgi:hypothetical protein